VNREIDFYCSDLQTGSPAIGQQAVAQFENESRQHAGKFVKQDKWFIYFEKSQPVVDQLRTLTGNINIKKLTHGNQ